MAALPMTACEPLCAVCACVFVPPLTATVLVGGGSPPLQKAVPLRVCGGESARFRGRSTFRPSPCNDATLFRKSTPLSSLCTQRFFLHVGRARVSSTQQQTGG